MDISVFLISVLQTFYYGNNVGYGYSQHFYLNNERKTVENFISVCVFENLFLMSVKMLLLLFTSLDDPASRYFFDY